MDETVVNQAVILAAVQTIAARDPSVWNRFEILPRRAWEFSGADITRLFPYHV